MCDSGVGLADKYDDEIAQPFFPLPIFLQATLKSLFP